MAEMTDESYDPDVCRSCHQRTVRVVKNSVDGAPERKCSNASCITNSPDRSLADLV